MEKDVDSGVMFPTKDKRSEKAPDVSGSFVMSPELVKKLGENYRAGKEMKVRIAGWRNTSRAGDQYYRIKVQEAVDKEDEKASHGFAL